MCDAPLSGSGHPTHITQLVYIQLPITQLHLPQVCVEPSLQSHRKTIDMLGRIKTKQLNRLYSSAVQFKRGLKVVASTPSSITIQDIKPSTTSAPGSAPAAPNKATVEYRTLFLRDACRSEACVDVSTSQKTFSTGDLTEQQTTPKSVSVSSGASTGTSTLHIEWADGHKSQYSEEFLAQHCDWKSRAAYRKIDTSRDWVAWESENSEQLWKHVTKVSFSDFVKSANQNQDQNAAYRDTLNSLNRNGIAIVNNIPEGEIDPSTQRPWVETIAQRIGYIKETFYGRSWDVKSVHDAKNVAYTSVYLPVHMDLCYYESPPGIQLLHVIENSARGGESLFADAYAAAKYVLKCDPEAYDALTKVPLTYHYENAGQHYYYARPVIEEDPSTPVDPATGRKGIKVMNYSPPFQGPFDAVATESDFDTATVNAFMRGLKMFESFANAPENLIHHKLEPQSCVLMMNRRLLHGRTQFMPTKDGRRWLKGTYLDLDAFYSALRVL